MKRINIKNILSNPDKRKNLFVETIIATQAREGIVTTKEQAKHAYDSVVKEKNIKNHEHNYSKIKEWITTPEKLEDANFSWKFSVISECGRTYQDNASPSDVEEFLKPKGQTMIYDKEQYKKWNRLDDHLKNPVNFPSNMVSNFLVVFDAPDGFKDKYPFKSGEQVLFLGEIPGMRGHGIFAPYNGSIVWGYHLDGFYVIPKEEL